MEKQNERVSNRLISLSTSSYTNFESFNQTQVAMRFNHWPCMASFSIRHNIRSAKNGDTSTEAASGIPVYRKTAHRRDTETSQDPLTYTPAHTYLNISLFCWPFWRWQWGYPICLWGHMYYSITLRTAYTDIAFRALVIYRALPSYASYGRDGCDEEYGFFVHWRTLRRMSIQCDTYTAGLCLLLVLLMLRLGWRESRGHVV